MACKPDQTFVKDTCIPTTCVVTINSKPTECADRGTCTNGTCVCKAPKLDPASKCEFCTGDVNLMPDIHPDIRNCYFCLQNFYKATDKTGKEICVPFKCIGANDVICNGNGICGKKGCECNSGVTYINEQCLFCTPEEEEIGAACYANSCVKEGVVCSENGTCQNSVCKCDEGMTGQYCNQCSDGYVMIESLGKCALKDCVFDQQICSGKTCNDDGSCICHSGTSGRYCQCGIGYRQAAEGDLRCLKDNCISSKKGQCYGRGTCIQKDSEYTCQDCGNFTFNDPNKGCEKCLPGSVKIPDSNNKCVAKTCMQEGTDRPCNSRGECVIIGANSQCKCRTDYKGKFCEFCAGDENLSQNCRTCKPGYEKHAGLCQPTACYSNGISCSGRGSCESGKCSCTTNLLDEKCQFCKDSQKDEKTNCATCLNGFLLVDGTCYNDKCQAGSEFDVNKRMCVKIAPGAEKPAEEKSLDGSPAEKQKSNVMLISGISIAVILVIAAVVGLVVFVVYKKKGMGKMLENSSQGNCQAEKQEIVVSSGQVLYKQ